MNRLLFFFLYLFSIAPIAGQTLFTLDSAYTTPPKEIRAMWLTTYSGLDWPSRPATTPKGMERQKAELCTILDQLQAAGINTVLFQARIRSTTSYPSAIEPWDEAFTGTPGKAPAYDPLQFAIEECHRRNMELHAWVVAFPIVKTPTAKQLGKQALPRRQPKLCQLCGNQWIMDPGVPETSSYLANLCKEIVERYAVDGIHLDYIRYPEKGIPFNDNRTYRKYGKGKQLADWRRENVTRVVRTIYETVKAVRPWVKVSCSPVGKYADLRQQSSYGWNARDAVYQEAQNWLRDGIMDILFPMMYFDGKHFYPFAFDWQENSYGRQVAPGLGIYFLHPAQKNWDLTVVQRQLYFLRQLHTSGQAHFRSRFFTDNVKGLYDFAHNDFYRRPVATPPMTWMKAVAPERPRVRLQLLGDDLQFEWDRAMGNTPDSTIRYTVYYCPADTFDARTCEILAFRLRDRSFRYRPALPRRLYGYYAVTATDAYGNESAAQMVQAAALGHSSYTIVDHQLDLPEVDGAEFVLICDSKGRPILTCPYQSTINVNQLQTGCYEVRSLGKKGRSHALLTFWKR